MHARFAVAFAIVAIPTAATLSAATRLVTTGGADSGNCTVSPCATLSYAIGQASSGDIIGVGPGAFSNGSAMVVVNKSVMLRGAQAGFDARTRGVVPESILTEPLQVAADGVAVDGFTISCGLCNPAGCVADCGTGLVTSSSFSGYSVINNIITGNVTGVTFGSSGATASTLAFNRIVDNNFGVAGLHYGIFTATAATNAVVDRNLLSTHEIAQINFVRLPPQSPATVTISNNSFPLGSTDGPAVVLIGNTGSVVSGNTVTGGNSSFGSIFIAGGDNNIAVAGNHVSGATFAAVMIWDFFFGLGVPFNGAVSVTGNTLLNNGTGVGTGPNNSLPIEVHFNRIVGNASAVFATTLVRGENNWFGCNAFPVACATFGGSVDFDPWLVMGISAIPPVITLAQTSSANVTFNRNSDGATVSGFPDGTSVAFSAAGGAISPPSSPTAGGLAAGTFTPSALGPATVSATLDSQTVSAPVIVSSDIPALSPLLLALLSALLAAIALLVLRR